MTETVDVDQLRAEYEAMKKAQAEARAQRESNSGGRPKVEKKHYWYPKNPQHTIRIIPVPGNDRWYRQFRQAWINRKPIVPPSTVDPEARDPHKDYLNQLRAVEGEAGKQAYLKVRDKEVAGVFVIERGHEDKGPQLWTMKQREFMRIQAIMYDVNAGQVYDLQNGRDLIINYSKGDKNGAVSIDPMLKESPAGTDEQIAEWTAIDLWQAYRVGEASDPDYIDALIAGKVDEFFKQKKEEWESKRAAQQNGQPEEAEPVSAPSHSTDSVADDAADALAAFAPKFYVKSPKDGSTLETPMTLAEAREQFGEDVEVQDMDMNGWVRLGDV